MCYSSFNIEKLQITETRLHQYIVNVVYCVGYYIPGIATEFLIFQKLLTSNIRDGAYQLSQQFNAFTFISLVLVSLTSRFRRHEPAGRHNTEYVC